MGSVRWQTELQMGMTMHFTINGKNYDADPDIRTTLLDLLRERLGLGHVLVGRLHGVRNDRATRGYRDPALDALSLRTRGLGKGEGHVLENWASNRRIFAGAG